MRKAVFFDRDGVLNRELGRYVAHADEFELNEWVIPFMHTLKNAGYVFFVITNQGGIAREIYTQDDLFSIHAKLTDSLMKHYLFFEEIFYCPHHPIKTQCLCRKPDNLMLEKAIAKYNVDISKSFMIGDSDRDEGAAEKTGLKIFKIQSNQPPDYEQFAEMERISGVVF